MKILDVTYHDRLEILGLHSLEHRRVFCDLVPHCVII